MLQVARARATNGHKKTEERVVTTSHTAYARNTQASHSAGWIGHGRRDTHPHGFLPWMDDKPVAHHTNRAPKENRRFLRRIPVNVAKRTDRKKKLKKKKKGKRSTYRAEAPATVEVVQERSVLAYNGAETVGPPTRWTP
jgi:hypothetical protein